MTRTRHRRVRTGSSCGRDGPGGTVLGIFPWCPSRRGPRCTTTPGTCTTPGSCGSRRPEAESCGCLSAISASRGLCCQVVVRGRVAVLVVIETACRLEGSCSGPVVIFYRAVVPGLRPVVRVPDYTSARLDIRTLPVRCS